MNELDLWDPFSRRRHFWRHFFSDDLFPTFSEGKELFPRGFRAPLVDVAEGRNDIKVLAELPGVDKKDINIKVEQDSISISAEQRESVREEDKKKGYYRQERSYSSFYRKLALPAEVIPDKTKAEIKNGILEITLEKKSPEKGEKGFKVEVR